MKPEDEPRRKPAPPYECKRPIVFEVWKGEQRCVVTVAAKYADTAMPIFGFAFALMAGGKGRIRIKS